MKNHKGQIAPAMLMSVGMILLLFTFVMAFVINKQSDLRDTEDYIEKRNECLKIANLINSVYVAGHGAQVQTTTDFVITVFNTSQISVTSSDYIEDLSKKRIAFLATGAGPTQEFFYEGMHNRFAPKDDWYKSCFGDAGYDCSGDSAWVVNLNYTVEDATVKFIPIKVWENECYNFKG